MDIRYAKEFGYVIKLIGMTRLTEGGVEVKVHPMLLPEQHPLSTVRDSFNAVFIHGEACDDAMFMGRGAGQLPTASAVMGDVIDDDAKHPAPFLRQDRLWLLPESSGEIRRGYGQSVFPTDSGNGQARRARQHCRDFGQ